MRSHKLAMLIVGMLMILASLLPGAGARNTEFGEVVRASSTGVQRPRPWDQRKQLALGTSAPEWQLKTVDGESIALADQRGSVVLLDFWANWCGPCRKLEPLIDQLVKEYQGRNVKVFTVSIWPDLAFDPQAYLREHKMAATFLVGTDAVANDYGIWGVPTYYVIDPEGKISYIHMLLSVNADSLDRTVRGAIDHALSKKQVNSNQIP